MTAKYITLDAAAETMSVSAKTIRRRIADGTLTAKRFGPRLIRVEAASLDRLMGVTA